MINLYDIGIAMIKKYKKNVIFTDYNTVQCDFLGELAVDKFFEKLEQGIKDRKITNCTIDMINNELTFELPKNYQKYHIIIGDEEFEKIKTGIPSRNTRKLLSLFDLEYNLIVKDTELLIVKSLKKIK